MGNYDLGIIGGGPAGYTAALHCAIQGKKIILFEKDEIGGVCLNKGCIPTKSILHVSEIFKNVINSDKYGITLDNPAVDYKKVIERKDNTVEKLRKGIELALKNAKITVIRGNAQIISDKMIRCDGTDYYCGKVLCAVGSSPRIIRGLEFDHKFILSSDDVLKLDVLPESILIVGSGAIGIEWARIFSNFGVGTTVVEMAPHLLPLADIEVSKRIERLFKAKGVKFYTETKVDEISGNTVKLSNGDSLNPEIILVAAGRVPNVKDKIEGVTYIGDSAGEIQLAHYAIKQAIAEIDGIKIRKDLIPSVVYGSPEIAWAGEREQDLEGTDYQKSLVLLSSLGKAHCDDCTDGFIKILAQNGKIIGAHIVSAEASSLIQQILIAIQNDISIESLKEVCFAHPTYSEGIFEGLFKL